MTAKHPLRRVRAAIYVRISKDMALRARLRVDGPPTEVAAGAVEGAGVNRQETACRENAEKHGWDVVEVYVDNDLSAFGNKPRPAYEQMLKDMKAGAIDAVVVWHPDRLTRRPAELETLMQIAEDNNVVFSTVQTGEIDLSTASGRLVARLHGAVARHEAELKGERQSLQLKQLAYDGRSNGGGTRPFGWIDHARSGVDPDEAAIIRKLAQLAIDGWSCGQMATWLEQQGVKTVRGKEVWHPPVVKRMLTNPTLAGHSVWRGEIVAKGTWEPILDEDTWVQVCDALAYTGPGRKNRGEKQAWLNGIIWCQCGYPLVTAQVRRLKTDPYTRVYSCRTKWMQGRPGWQKACGRMTIKAEWVEDDIAEQMVARLSMPASRKAFDKTSPREPVGDPGVELEKIATRLKDLGTDYADGLVERPTFIAATQRLKERRQILLDATRPRKRPQLPYGSIEKLAAWWESATFTQKRSTARLLIDRVDVGPHQGRRSEYDPKRVKVEWRD